MDEVSLADARRFFPRGLEQPEGRFRFSIDALLLAAFWRPHGPTVGTIAVADLGAGCGVAGLGLLLRFPEHAGLRLWSLDNDPAMVEAAAANAARLGFDDRAVALAADCRRLPADKPLPAESMDLVLANPPYRRAEQGRRSASPARSQALFELAGGLEAFTNAAAYLLKPKASFCLIHLAERLADALTILRGARLEPKRILPVQSRSDAPAKLALIEARKAARPGLTLEPALALYTGRGSATRISEQALAFCPFLACNVWRVSKNECNLEFDPDPDAQTPAA